LNQECVSLLVSNMREDAREGKEVDMVQNFNLTTFDNISDLSFGQSFGGLKTRTPHPWIKAFYDLIMIRPIVSSIMRLKIPLISPLIGLVILPMLPEQLGTLNYTSDKIEERIDQETDKHDFMSYVLKDSDGK
jgi:Cytochrome P450